MYNSSYRFTEPFKKPIEYENKVAEITNLLSNGDVVVQRLGDILNGKRTWQEELDNNSVKLNERLETNIKNLYAIGDGAGLTRGLMMASCSGVYLARNLYR